MTEFSSITYEALINGKWTDLTPDVMDEPTPKFSRGIQNNGVNDLVADPGALTFSLKNGANNSAGLIGYYSPGHANCLSGWSPALTVRLTFAYGSWRRVKWLGYIEPDGISVTPHTLGERRVDVSCVDYMGLLSRYKISLMTLQADQYMSGAIDTLLATIYHQPDSKVYADTGDLMSVVFDTSTVNSTVLGELQKIAVSELQYIAVRGGGNGETLRTSPPTDSVANLPVATTDGILSFAGDHILSFAGNHILQNATTVYPITDDDTMTGTSIPYGGNITNHITAVTYPRKPDAAATTVLWTLDKATLIAAGTKLTMRGSYNDPATGVAINGTDFTNPLVSGVDYKANANANGTGADRTSQLSVTASFGAAEVELVLYNTGGTSLYVGGGTAGAFLQVIGRGIHIDDVTRVVISDATSVRLYGEKPITIDMKYQDEPDLAVEGPFVTPTILQKILIVNKDPQYTFDKVALCANRNERNMIMFMFYEPRDVLNISDTMTGVVGSYQCIQGYEAEIVGGKYVFWSFTGKMEGL